MKNEKKKKTKYKTVSIPKPLADDIKALIDKYGYWNSLGTFIREAAITKLKKERQELELFPEPTLILDPDNQ